VTINAVLAGTNGFTVVEPGNPYAGFGLVLGGANPISGQVSGYSTYLTLRNTQALQNATLLLAPSGTLRLRHDTDGATFLTAGLPQSGSTSATIINVDRDTAAGLTNHTLLLTGDYTTPGRGLSVTGTNGYRLELTGSYSNSYGTGRVPTLTADSANLTISGSSFYTGVGGILLGGALATGTNEIKGTVSGLGPFTKLADPSRWVLSGATVYTGATTIAGGTLGLAGSATLAASALVTVGPGATLDAVGIPAFTRSAGQTLNGGGVVLGNLDLAANSTLAPGTNSIATLTVTGNVSVAGAWLADVDATAVAADRVTVDGNLTLDGASRLVLATNGSFSGYATVTLASYSGALTGAFGSVTNVPVGFTLDYGAGSNSVIQLYNLPRGAVMAIR
jgi:fibronectin-binding autotransporter adhesin